MQEYINRVRRLGPNDMVNGDTFNSVVDQLQHNIDLLYRSQASSVQNWNVSELMFGNLMDYDEIGQKRYNNGGKLDAIEKVLAFTSDVGNVDLEESDRLNNNYWLRWDIPQSLTNNVTLVRNVSVPQALRHQNIIIGFKLAAYEGNDLKINERYEIYVNGVYSGTGETGVTTIDGVQNAKTIYGVYHLTGTESNLEIALVRSVTNGATPSNYVVRVQNVFTGLHTLGNDSFSLNYPVSGSSFIGAGADINAFYDFNNNAVRPIPSFLINSEQLEGSGSLTVNISAQAPPVQTVYHIGLSGTGNFLGVNGENIMPAEDFFDKEIFPSSTINVNLKKGETYEDFHFNKGNYILHVDADVDEINVDNIYVSNSSSVHIVVDPHQTTLQKGTLFNVDNLVVEDKSRFEIHAEGDQHLRFQNKFIDVKDSSYLEINAGTFSQPIVDPSNFKVTNGGKAKIHLYETTLSNGDGSDGYALSLGTVKLDHYSFLYMESDAVLFSGEPSAFISFGLGTEDVPINLDNHSHLSIKGFGIVTCSSAEKTFRARLHSSIEIFDPIQVTSNGGIQAATSFENVNLELFSTFGTIENPDDFVQDFIESFIYQIEE